jgi:hypothetical protein
MHGTYERMMPPRYSYQKIFEKYLQANKKIIVHA